MTRTSTALLLIALAMQACSEPASAPPDPPAPEDAAADAAEDTGPPLGDRPVPPPTFLPVDDDRRVVAIGDVHGDIAAARAVLRLAGILGDGNTWVGGETVVVQVGDQLDRGDDEQAILELFERLSDAAWEAGGGFYPLHGNHETMNVALDFRYVTTGGWADFADQAEGVTDPEIMAHPEPERGRVVAFRPGGPFARLLAGHNTVMVVGDTIFVHGGVVPSQLALGLENINAEVQGWMRGELPRPTLISSDDSVVWSRHFSRETDAMDCQLLDEVLTATSASRMVVAHSVQSDGINAECAGRVWRVDVGLARHYGGSSEALEIVGDTVRVLR